MKWSIPKYRMRLITFCLMIGICPVIFVGLASYLHSSSEIQDKVNQGNKQLLLQTQQRIERVLYTIDNTLSQFIGAYVVNQALHEPLNSEQFEMLNELFRGLYWIQSYELGVKDIHLVSLENRWIIDSRGLQKFGDFSSIMEEYRNFAATTFWVKQNANIGLYQTREGTDGYLLEGQSIHLVKKLPVNALNPSGFILVEIPVKEIARMLNVDSALGSLFILDSQFNPLVIGADKEDPGVLKQFLSVYGADNANHQTNFDYNGRRYSITYEKSNYNNWIYGSVVSIEQLTRDSSQIGWITLVTCLGIIVITVAVSLQLSGRLYKPILHLYHACMGQERLRGKTDEFDAISVRLKRMNTQLENNLPLLQSYFIRKLFMGEVRPEETPQQLMDYQLSGPWDMMCVYALQIDNLDDTRFSEKDKDLLMFAINNIVQELHPPTFRLGCIPMQQTQIFLIGRNNLSEESFKTTMFEIAETLQSHVEQFMKLKLAIGISRPTTSLVEAVEACQEAVEALKYRIRLERETLLYIEDCLPGQCARPTYPSRSANQLLDAIKAGDAAIIDELVHSFVVEVLRVDLSHREYQVMLVRFLTDVITLEREYGEPTGLEFDERGRSVFDQCFELQTAQEIEHWLGQSIIHPLVQHMEKRRLSQYQITAEAMRQIIHDEYDTELTLEICAQRLNYHPNHLKRVFRIVHGMNFSDYVSAHRMNMAKLWLTETEMSIAEIARKLQYNNSQNFIRFFRKTESVTPGEYRKRAFELKEGSSL
ncbi:helix-turn-helix domain-containing protein [Paenibacillus piri]|uniref:AraC family transcriptional regulator n=1 Tax=Paenibacillus piri TaxID=2547395 RepID=A0A4R5KFH1_9BACL|nr:helix-turn-helix domain-containing protein [Paenibacillus piri]TDF92930.1 AraC family transcriptional regulator [Paenibacillus piri]